MSIRVLVTGGRGYADRQHVRSVLGALHSERRIGTLVQGGAIGADALAAEWARQNGVAVVTVKADWARLGKAAGPERNHRMVDRGAEQNGQAYWCSTSGAKAWDWRWRSANRVGSDDGAALDD